MNYLTGVELGGIYEYVCMFTYLHTIEQVKGELMACGEVALVFESNSVQVTEPVVKCGSGVATSGGVGAKTGL